MTLLVEKRENPRPSRPCRPAKNPHAPLKEVGELEAGEKSGIRPRNYPRIYDRPPCLTHTHTSNTTYTIYIYIRSYLRSTFVVNTFVPSYLILKLHNCYTHKGISYYSIFGRPILCRVIYFALLRLSPSASAAASSSSAATAASKRPHGKEFPAYLHFTTPSPENPYPNFHVKARWPSSSPLQKVGFGH